MAGPIEDRIREKLTREFSPTYLEIDNESNQHNVPRGSETHFRVVVVSNRFEGLNRVARARLVHEVLAEELSGGVHALSHKTLTPAEWEAQGGQVNMTSPPCLGGSKNDPQRKF